MATDRLDRLSVRNRTYGFSPEGEGERKRAIRNKRDRDRGKRTRRKRARSIRGSRKQV